MKQVLVALALTGVVSAPALAQDAMNADPSCTDYMAMDAEGQMMAMESMGTGMDPDSMSEEMESDAMAADSNEDMAEGEAADAMAADPAGAMAGEEMTPGDMMAGATEACTAHPDATVSDAMKMMTSG